MEKAGESGQSNDFDQVLFNKKLIFLELHHKKLILSYLQYQLIDIFSCTNAD